MYAVASLLYSPDYLPGALVLGHRLQKMAPPDTDLVLLVDLPRFSDRQISLLAQVWTRLVDVNVVLSLLVSLLRHTLKRPELAQTYTKIHLWGLDYSKVLYLDADTLPLLDGQTTVVDLLRLDFPKGKILAAPDSGFPDIFNSGVFGLQPNKDDYRNLVALAASNNPGVSFDGADQGLLNQYFNANPDWVSLQLAGQAPTSNWVQIPFLYNTTPTSQYEYLPAFNYFTGNPGPNGSDSLSSPDELHPGSVPQELSSVFETLGAYGSAAVSYFSSKGPLVKLVHFIGPLKPWKSEGSGLFQKWWDAWYDYSHGLSIHEKLGEKPYSVSIKRLVVPGLEPEPDRIYPQDFHTDVSADYHKDVNTNAYSEPQQVEENSASTEKVFKPEDLCDPANYQHMSTPEFQSAAAWDATVEEPPRTRPENVSFTDDLQEYENEWEHVEEEIEEETREDEEEEEFVEQEEEEEEEELTEFLHQPQKSDVDYFGFHSSQVAERVFDEKSDYNPLHSLLKAKDQLLTLISKMAISEKESDTKTDAKTDTPAPKKAETVPVDEKPKDEKQEDKKADVDTSESEVGSSKEQGVPKLFPWEFKTSVAPERTFGI